MFDKEEYSRWLVQAKQTLLSAENDSRGLSKAKERREKQQLELVQIAKEYSMAVKAILKKASIVIYGSVARGDFGRASDIDILVVSDSLSPDLRRRFDVLYSSAEHGIEPKGYTQDEFSKLMKKPNFREMLRGKIVLLDDLGVFG